jgi:hypothetical protein
MFSTVSCQIIFYIDECVFYGPKHIENGDVLNGKGFRELEQSRILDLVVY